MSVKSIFRSDLLFEEYINQTHLRGFSVGYESKEFRYDALVDTIFDALPDFCLSYNEKETFGVTNFRRKIKKAAQIVYSTEKYKRRGEYGEVLLHVIMRDFYNTIPAISKMYYKDGANETVKGFDAVHIVTLDEMLELWLGEVKFYNNISNAIRDVIPELQYHTDKDYLRSEFLFISNKIDDSWPYSDELKDLIDGRTTLDKVFKCLKIPVLLTYDSPIVKKYETICENYKNELIAELKKHNETFRGHDLPQNIDFILLLIPLEEKQELVKQLHQRLEVWQAL